MAKLKRSESRELACVLLFEWTFRDDETLEEIIEHAEHCRELSVDAFAKELANAAIGHVQELDHLIGRFSANWKINRISRVTLSVLRLGLAELSLRDDIPAGAAINEAVELMKKYATPDEAAYVNGVLGAYHRSRKGEEEPEAVPIPEPVELPAADAPTEE
jgi:N utilization substance protein B